ncbi:MULTISPECIES: TPM domain-containing protein [unclassified Arthrobacter]|uniref:TPM domain-containing protein n=1 Tax=unclassified Arthrobacter TaxID=235627 RepID=UPI001490B160|nr:MULTISPECIES: TPM domain-containing protein [unclassified Arthrobacter]MBE0008714.1 TPM domain-containing protein [Arthrobacter sp. AET 35A]NOJ62547.1 TPM domain-containing protein [Arthrobacter sp. 147(2020)]
MRSSTRRLAATVGVTAALMLPLTTLPGVYAAPPVDFGAEEIIDDAGVLDSGGLAELEDAIAQLRDEEGYRLRVVYVDTFTDPEDPEEWTAQTAELSGLGESDLLLTVAIGDESSSGQANFVAANSSPVRADAPQIYTSYILPELEDGNWAAAGVAAATGVSESLAGETGGSGNDDNESNGGGSALGAIILVGALVALAGIGGFFFLRSRSQKSLTSGPTETQDFGPGRGPDGEVLDPLAAFSVEDLRKKAGSLLIAADDAIKSSEQEVGFAQAQYGDAAVQPFVDDIAAAKTHMSESFKLQQQLDDHIPDTEEQQRTWLGDIIRRCESVNSSLQEHKADFDALRELERNAPAALAAAQRSAEEVRTRVATAEQTLRQLQQKYADSATSQVQDNVEQANERLEFVDSASASAQQHLDAGDTGSAVIAVRAAEESVHQTTVLLEAISKRATELDAAKEELDRSVSDTAQDLAQAQAMLATGQHQELAGPVASAEAALNTVRTESSAGRVDPVSLLQRTEAAHAQLDAALGGVKNQTEQTQRAREALQHAIMAAQSRISGTSDYIRARRGGVGSEARTRLAEAERNLDYAVQIQSDDPVAALSHAQQATALAEQAAQIAQQDVDGFGGGMGGFGGGGMFGGRGNQGGGGMGGALLGGILLGGILNGGGGGGGLFGGGGGDSGGGFGGGGGDMFGGGGFGGFGGGGGGFGDFGGGGGDF